MIFLSIWFSPLSLSLCSYDFVCKYDMQEKFLEVCSQSTCGTWNFCGEKVLFVGSSRLTSATPGLLLLGFCDWCCPKGSTTLESKGTGSHQKPSVFGGTLWTSCTTGVAWTSLENSFGVAGPLMVDEVSWNFSWSRAPRRLEAISGLAELGCRRCHLKLRLGQTSPWMEQLGRDQPLTTEEKSHKWGMVNESSNSGYLDLRSNTVRQINSTEVVL